MEQRRASAVPAWPVPPPAVETPALGELGSASGSPGWPFPSAQRSYPDPDFRRAPRSQDCPGLQCELRWAGVELDPGLGLQSPHPLSPPAPAPPPRTPSSCGHLVLCPALPWGSQSKNLSAFFIHISESPSAPQRGRSPPSLFPAPLLPPWGLRMGGCSCKLACCGESRCREGPGVRAGPWVWGGHRAPALPLSCLWFP